MMKTLSGRHLAYYLIFLPLSLQSLQGQIDWAFVTVGEGDIISGTVRSDGDPTDVEGSGLVSFTVTDLLAMRVNGTDVIGDFSTALVRSNQAIRWDRDAQVPDYDNLSAVIFDFESGGIGLQIGSGRLYGGPNSFTRGSVRPSASFRSSFTGYLPLDDGAGGFSVVFEAEYGGGFDGGGPVFQLVQAGQAAVAPVAVADADFNFLGWDANFDSITEDTVITAEFEVVPEIRDNPLKLFVADQLNGRILSYDLATGTLEGTYGIANQDDSSIMNPSSLTIHDQLLYVGSSNSDEIIVYDRSRVASAIAARPDFGSGSNDDVAVATNGDIFAHEYREGIIRYDSQGQRIGLLAGSEPETLHADGIGSIGGLLFGPAGRLFVVVSDNQNVEDRIITFAADGTFEGTFGEALTGSSPISNPRDLAFDSNGNLFVLDSPGILKYDSEGNYLETLLPSVYPYSIALDSDDNIYLGDSDEVVKYSPTGDLLETIIPSDFGLQNAVGLAIGELRDFQVAVFNLSVAQLPGTKTMEITYDVASTESAEVTVSLEVSDGGTAVSAPSVSGDVGSGVATGTGKTILWDMAADWNGNVATLNYTVVAEDRLVVAPEGMVLVDGGTLPESSGLGAVAVDTFYIGQYEVTWGEWKTVRAEAQTAGRDYDIGNVGAGCADDHPVHSVNWYDVIKWCNLKSELEGLTPVYTYNDATYDKNEPTHTLISQNLSANGYRLPQEAEWEFAARAGNQTNGYTYAGSNDLGTVGWYWDNSWGAACDLFFGGGTWPVGQKAANELGLYDMSGNVWEWCWDQNDSSSRSMRGGSWADYADFCTVSYRYAPVPSFQYDFFGFRLVRSSGN